jgi:hypothetical protein
MIIVPRIHRAKLGELTQPSLVQHDDHLARAGIPYQLWIISTHPHRTLERYCTTPVMSERTAISKNPGHIKPPDLQNRENLPLT